MGHRGAANLPAHHLTRRPGTEPEHSRHPTRARSPSRRHGGALAIRRAARPLRCPLAALVVCSCCGKKLQGNMAPGLAFYRCKATTDYPLLPDGRPASVAVREVHLLPHVDAWVVRMFAVDQIEETARQVVNADTQTNREDPAISRARATLVECKRKLSRYLDGLEAGIPADVDASRIASAQGETEAAQAVFQGPLGQRNLSVLTNRRRPCGPKRFA